MSFITADRIAEMLVTEIAEVCPEVGTPGLDASLTGDLGLDSLCLTSLFGMVKKELGQVELSTWFIRASNTGTDTIGSLSTYLAAQLAGRQAA